MIKKKVLIIDDEIICGGVEIVMRDLALYFNLHDYDVTIYSSLYQEGFEDIYPTTIHYVRHKNYHEIEIPYSKYSFRWFLQMKDVLAIRRGKKEEEKYLNAEYDIVIAIKEGPCMQIAQRVNAKKKYGWVHVDYNKCYWTKYTFNAQDEVNCMKKFDGIICVSNAVKESIIEVVGDPGNLIVRYNPLNAKAILENSLASTNRLKKKDKITFVSVGRLDNEQKGYDRLLRCCEKLNKKYDYELWIIGDGADRKLLQEYIISHNLNNVYLFGNQDNPYKYLKYADCFVCSSIWESFSLAIQEAVILGKPILTTNCPGACELLDEDFSIVVENSEEGILEGMTRILDNQEILDAMKNKVPQRENEFYYENRIKDIEQLWKDEH